MSNREMVIYTATATTAATLGGAFFGPAGAMIAGGLAIFAGVVGKFGKTIVEGLFNKKPGVLKQSTDPVVELNVIKKSVNFNNSTLSLPTCNADISNVSGALVKSQSAVDANQFALVKYQPRSLKDNAEAYAQNLANAVLPELQNGFNTLQTAFKSTTAQIGTVSPAAESALNSIGSHAKKAALHAVSDHERLGANIVVNLAANSIINVYNNGRYCMHPKNLARTLWNTGTAVVMSGAFDYAKETFLPEVAKATIHAGRETISSYTHPVVGALAEAGLTIAATYGAGYALSKTADATKSVLTFAYNKCCSRRAKVVKEAANETKTLTNTAVTTEEVELPKQEGTETPVLQIPELQQDKPVLVRRSSKEALLEVAKKLPGEMRDVATTLQNQPVQKASSFSGVW